MRAPRLRLAVAVTAAALLLASGAAHAQPPVGPPPRGFLQFSVAHNLDVPGCISNGSCFLELEEQVDPVGWLAQVAMHSQLAVLHWDRAIPWLIFDVDPPFQADRVAHYDALLDAPTRAWLDAFAAHFAALGTGYVAVSILSGTRDALADLHIDLDQGIPVGTACPDFSPGVQVSVDPGSGPVSFDLQRSYRNFVLFLIEKLGPDFVGLMVEINLIESTCPGSASGLYALYRALYDTVRTATGPGPRLFATLSYPRLLGYDRNACYPGLEFESCTGPPSAPQAPVGEAACYPIDRGAIDALDLGGRLDVLALSFYPDGLQMTPAGGGPLALRAYARADWDAGASCTAREVSPTEQDPLAALDRLGWTGPVAVAETSSRSCASPVWIQGVLPGGSQPEPLVFEIDGAPDTQAIWMARSLAWARQRGFLFYVQSFLRDYRPIGPWTVDAGILPAETQALFNIWPCSGLQTEQGAAKPTLQAIWAPEPSPGALALAAAGGLLALCAVRRPLSARRPRFSATNPPDAG